jgi:hypothetical protein
MGNLSSLITDAFNIYSEAYVKIGQLGSKVVDLKGSSLQPSRVRQLVHCTRLYRVITPSLILNDAGTAITWVVGDVGVMNNLLLRLKRCVGLYDLPVFPTPLTDIVIDLSGGSGGNSNASYLTQNTESSLPQSRKLLVSGNLISDVDGGASGNRVLSANLMDIASVDVSGSTPAINMNNELYRLFKASANITGTKTWSISNAGKKFEMLFVISGLTPGASTHDQTWPSTFKMSDARWELNGSKKWTPATNGEYIAKGTTYDGTNWRLEISEAYS